jgi:hypothetical protein
VLKSSSSRQIFADELPNAFELYNCTNKKKPFDIRDYGVCFLEDMLAEVPESVVCRKEIKGRTFIQLPMIVQTEDERLCTFRLRAQIIDMLRVKPRFCVSFEKFTQSYQHHFGYEFKLSNYGFSKLVELFETIPQTVRIITKDHIQFIQLERSVMMDIVCCNLIILIEENNHKLTVTNETLLEMYNNKFESLYHFQNDFECSDFKQLLTILPFDKHCIRAKLTKGDHYLFVCNLEVDPLNESELEHFCSRMLATIMDDGFDEKLCEKFEIKKESMTFGTLCEFIYSQINFNNLFTRRSLNYISKCLADFFVIGDNNNQNVNNSSKYAHYTMDHEILDLSETYLFAKQIRNLFKLANVTEMAYSNFELMYRRTYKTILTRHCEQTSFPHRQLGFVHSRLLFSEGLKLLLTLKNSDKRVVLNEEFCGKLLLFFVRFKFCFYNFIYLIFSNKFLWSIR